VNGKSTESPADKGESNGSEIRGSEWPPDTDSHSLVPECASVARHARIICINEFWNGI
jgi:hypothetical protein